MRKLIEDEILKATTYDELPKSITNILTKADYRQQAFNGEFGQQNCGLYFIASIFKILAKIQSCRGSNDELPGKLFPF